MIGTLCAFAADFASVVCGGFYITFDGIRSSHAAVGAYFVMLCDFHLTSVGNDVSVCVHLL